MTVADDVALLDGRYELVRELGRGGQGISWLARDAETGEEVVVKELVFAGIDDWKPVELFEREAEVLRGLDHPGIPRFIATFVVEADGDHRRYLVREYVEGQSLEAVLGAGRHFREAEAVDLARAVLRILDYLHSQQPPIIHRDIKPSNLIERPDGSIALLDFGVAQIVPTDTFGSSTLVGTTGYIAPEQLVGHARPASDLYALGATLVHLLTHRHPALLPVERLRVKFRGLAPVSADLADFIDRLLAPDLDERLETAKKALVALRFEVGIGEAGEGEDDGALVLATPQVPALPRGSSLEVAVEPGQLEIRIESRRRRFVLRALAFLWVNLLAGFGIGAVVTGGWGFIAAAAITLAAGGVLQALGGTAYVRLGDGYLELASVNPLTRRLRLPADQVRGVRIREAADFYIQALVIQTGEGARVPASWRDINGDLLVERHLSIVERRWLCETLAEAVRPSGKAGAR